MTLHMTHRYLENKKLKYQTTIQENITSMYFEDQRWCNNGMWLMCHLENNAEIAIEFDPTWDEWSIHY